MKALPTLILLATLASTRAYATCSYPQAPDKIPDGATATKEEMVAAQKLVVKYNADIKAYTDCLKLEHDEALAKADNDKLTKEQKEALQKQLDNIQTQKNNAAVDAAEAVTARFNEQIRAFNKKGK
jgi:hypothetical protein